MWLIEDRNSVGALGNESIIMMHEQGIMQSISEGPLIHIVCHVQALNRYAVNNRGGELRGLDDEKSFRI